jgi:PAS domain S-box-containing protein
VRPREGPAADAESLDAVGQLRRRERQQAAVAELGRSALTGAPTARLVEQAVSFVRDCLETDRASVLELSPDGAELLCRVSVGWDPEEIRPVPLARRSQVAHTFLAQEAVVVHDLATDERFDGSRHLVDLGITSGISAPTRGEDQPLGVIAAHSRFPRAFTDDDVVFLRAVANVLAVATAREHAEDWRRRSEEGLEFLAEAGHVMAGSLDYEATLSALARLAVPRLADWFILDVIEADGSVRRVAVAAADPRKQEMLEDLSRRYPPSPESPQPAGRALRTGKTAYFPEFTPETLRATTRDDYHFGLMTRLDPRSAIAVPLVARDRTIGAITFAWSESRREYDGTDVALAEELARRAALAIDNARLYRGERDARAAAEDAHKRLAFLAEASELLAASLDYGETLANVARLAVPRVADWCVIYMANPDGTIERLAVEHGGGRQDVAKAILAAHPLDPDATAGVPQVIRTGEPELHREATPLALAADVDRPEALAGALADIEVRSTMCVPLVARERTLGAILFVSAESGRLYGPQDLRLAGELARRAALAVDNSRLYGEAEERAEAAKALATIGDGVFLADADGSIRLWNPAAEAITGLAATEVRGRRADEVLPGWAAVAGRIPVAELPQAGRTSPQTIPLELGDRERWLSVLGVGSPEGTVYTFRDVTEERRLDQLKSDFVATVSHELRTPLAAIYGAAVTLSERDWTANASIQRELLKMIEQQSERLTSIVSDILLASELEAGRFRLNASRADAAEIARSALEAARTHLQRDVTIELVADPGLEPLETDPGRLRQVLDNLVENAVKYSPPGSLVEVRVEALLDHVRFSVRDEGIGIPREEHDKIFEKFYRLDPNQTLGVGGTGLGLYVCRELVERMSGRITVDSAPGRGSTFAFELPRNAVAQKTG